ncbi:hypothetical protein DVS77_28705 [Mycolicibacterium moriokaense]|nr:hypothetical protein DVS77_28705 [Mycolicibacterium moriokaense]
MAGLAATAALIGPAAPAGADVPTAGADCGSGQIGESATAPDGGAIRCVVDEQGKLHWLPDTHAVGTIADLQSQGYTVTVDRAGDKPLADCTVGEVHNAMTTTSLNSGGTTPGGPGSVGNKHQTTIVVSKSVDVTLDCTH